MRSSHDTHDFSRGRKFGAEELHLLLTALLADAPSHGYELINLLDTRSNGFYRPSPGMVYPALTYLEEIGYAGISVAGNRKCYTLTDEGRAYLDANRERVEMLWAKLNYLGKKMTLVRRALADGDDAGHDAIRAAFHRLKVVLSDRKMESAAEQTRIAKVLERAMEEIRSSGDREAGEA
jgi:DNA-binding PadR family transcriptional regulator